MRSSAVSVLCLLGALLAMAATALGASAIHFEPETLSALEAQIHHGQVHALSIHPAAGTGHIHVSLNDGRHMTVAFASTEEAHLIAIGRAAGTPIAVAKAKPKKATKAAKHKLRYIAAGILVVVIIVVAAVLLLDRRRKLGEVGGDEAESPPAAPSGETT